MAKNSTYDSVKQSLKNTTFRGGGKAANTGKNTAVSKQGWVEESTTADKPIFYTGKK